MFSTICGVAMAVDVDLEEINVRKSFRKIGDLVHPHSRRHERCMKKYYSLLRRVDWIGGCIEKF